LTVLTRYNVPKAEQEEFFAVLEGTKSDIVTGARPAVGSAYSVPGVGYPALKSVY